MTTPKTMVEIFKEVMADFPMNSMHEEVYDMAIEVMEGRTKKWTHAEANRRFAQKMQSKRRTK